MLLITGTGTVVSNSLAVQMWSVRPAATLALRAHSTCVLRRCAQVWLESGVATDDPSHRLLAGAMISADGPDYRPGLAKRQQPCASPVPWRNPRSCERDDPWKRRMLRWVRSILRQAQEPCRLCSCPEGPEPLEFSFAHINVGAYLFFPAIVFRS